MKACMVAYTFYEFDMRVRRYAESLAKRGADVSAFALRSSYDQSEYEVINGVRLFRIQARIINEKGKFSYFFRLVKFFMRSSYHLLKSHFHKPFDIIHVHSVPDFEVFAAIIPKFLGAKIILDIHDIVPEFYAAKFNVQESSKIVTLLLLLEKIACRFSDHVIIANHLWEKKLLSRSVRKEKCTALINYPDSTIFKYKDINKSTEKFIFLYPGSLNHHQGLDIAINAFSIEHENMPNAEIHIYGSGPSKAELIKLSKNLNIQEKIFFFKSVRTEKIASIMANADVGIIPKRNDSFGGEAFSTKSLEFMSVGTPVIMSKTKIDDHYFNDKVVQFFEPDNVNDLSSKMLSLYKSKKKREIIKNNALKFSSDYSWQIHENVYLKIIERIIR